MDVHISWGSARCKVFFCKYVKFESTQSSTLLWRRWLNSDKKFGKLSNRTGKYLLEAVQKMQWVSLPGNLQIILNLLGYFSERDFLSEFGALLCLQKCRRIDIKVKERFFSACLQRHPCKSCFWPVEGHQKKEGRYLLCFVCFVLS